MSSIIKVDQIQRSDGSTPTAGDLGIDAISDYSEFRITSNLTVTGNTTNDFSSNLTKVISFGDAVTESSGVYTLPSTGYWQMTGHFRAFTSSGAVKEIGIQLMQSTDSGSSFSKISETLDSGYAQYAYASGMITAVVDVTDISTFRFKFRAIHSGNVSYVGSSNNQTYFTFKKLRNT